MSNDVNTIKERKVVLPTWLDALIFNDERVINVFMPKLSPIGVICLADITSFNSVSQEWLPVMLDNASKACNVEILYQNNGFNEDYHITHTHHRNDTSKIAWRIYRNKK